MSSERRHMSVPVVSREKAVELAANALAARFSKNAEQMLAAAMLDVASVECATSGSRARWVKALRALGELCISQAKLHSQ